MSIKNSDFDKEKIEELIRSGHSDIAESLLRKIEIKKLNSENLYPFAHLAGRLGLPLLGIEALNPIVTELRSTNQLTTRIDLATEYADLLTQYGLNEEALQIYDEIEDETDPKLYLYKAFTYFSIWDYARAKPCLEKYVSHKDLTQYQKIVGMVNLAECYLVLNEIDSGVALLNDLLKLPEKFNLAIGNAHLQLAALYLTKEKLNEAHSHLESAQKLLKKAPLIYKLSLAKWTSFYDSKTGNVKLALQSLNEIKATAQELKLWETARDCDFIKLQIDFNADEFNYLYAGTPYAGYRERLLKIFGSKSPNITSYNRVLHKGSNPEVLDLSSDFFENYDQGKKSPINIYKLLLALARDFYKPSTIGSLHAFVFQDEFFNPHTSPNRISQLIHRSRIFLEEAGAHIEIVNARGVFEFKSSSPAAIKLNLDLNRKMNFKILSKLNTIKSNLKDDAFTSEQVSNLLNLPLRTTVRLLSEAKKENLIEAIAVGKKVKYQFKKSS